MPALGGYGRILYKVISTLNNIQMDEKLAVELNDYLVAFAVDIF